MIFRRQCFLAAALLAVGLRYSNAFVPMNHPRTIPTTTTLWASAPPTSASFIDTELRGAAMKLHTHEQAPKEGEVKGPERKPYTPTREDYLAFLVDSQHVYQAFEDLVNEKPELERFRNTGLERTEALETDIEFMCNEYGLKRPEVGEPGKQYAQTLRGMESVPEIVCHYYNHYFAHTAGGLMIGKKMSSLLLDKKTLEFYKVRTTIGYPSCKKRRKSTNW